MTLTEGTTMNRKIITAAVAGGAAILPATASAHPVTVACSPTGPVVSAPDYRGATADSIAMLDGFATVTFSDGFVVVVPLPKGCPIPPVDPGPTPAPTPNPPELVPNDPPAGVAPPTVTTPTVVVPPKRPTVRPKPRPKRATCADLRRRGAGERWYFRLRCPLPLTPIRFGPDRPFRGVTG